MARKTRQTFPLAAPDEEPLPASAGKMPASARRSPMFAKGAASIENAVKSAAAEDRMFRLLPVTLIDPSPIRDRIDVSENLEDLKRSLREEGQQIPILVRPVGSTDRYEIVTGRRRLQATKEIGGETIQAFVRRMSDEEAFVAQGVENNARLETSFIERARTILSALEAGFTQVQVEKFLGVDQTMISRMKNIYTGIGEDLVLRIGPARGVGRRKWEKLQKLVTDSNLTPPEVMRLVPATGEDSVTRFEGLLDAMERRSTPAIPAEPRTKPADKPKTTSIADGRLSLTRKPGQLVLKPDAVLSDGFLDYVAGHLPALLAEYDATRTDD